MFFTTSNVGDIVVRVLEVFVLLQQRRLIDLVIGGDSAIMGYLGQLPHIIQVVTADVDVQKHWIPVSILFTNQVVKLFPDRCQRLRQPLFDIYRIYANIESGNPCVGKFCRLRWSEDISICQVLADV